VTAELTTGPAANARAVDSTPRGAERLDLRVGDLRQLFNSMDPAPFRERDLDPKAESYIVDWARELRAEAPLALVVHTSREPATIEHVAILQQAIHEYFSRSAADASVRLKRLFRRGRWNLLIGLLFVAAANIIGDVAAEFFTQERYGRLVRDSFGIGAWVALWRPIEIFLYDWWPIVAESRLYRRLSGMHVSVVSDAGAADAARQSGAAI